MPIQTITHEGQLLPDQEKTYVHVPFEVPNHVVRIEAEYDYDQRISAEPTLSGGNTIDLGLFDERGIDFLKAGFRGWSGSERDSFFITGSEATPGYLSGPLNPGRWHVLLGLYKIAPQGCHYRVTIKITTQAGFMSRGQFPRQDWDLAVSPPPAQYSPWLRGELHCHSHHSDGKLKVDQIVTQANETGLDFLAITDHNTTASLVEQTSIRNPGLILIRGMEVTTFKGHFNVWGIAEWVDFRVENEDEMRAAVQFANQLGGLTSCGHPKPYGPPWEYPAVANYHCLEVWNGPWEAQNQLSMEVWLKLLAEGRRIPAVAGSDYHRSEQKMVTYQRAPGAPCTWVYAPGGDSAAAILQAIRSGHTSLSEQPDGPLLELRAGAGYAALGGDAVQRPQDPLPVRARCLNGAGGELRLLDQTGVRFTRILDRVDSTTECALTIGQSMYLRAELRADNGRLMAMSNPIYLDN